MVNLQDKVAIVTGGSRGIGKAIAKKLASQKANVVINYTSNEEHALKTKEEIESYGVKSMIVKCDVSKSSEVDNMIESVVKEFGKVDILVNNAGITKDGLLMRMKEDDFEIAAQRLKEIIGDLYGIENDTEVEKIILR